MLIHKKEYKLFVRTLGNTQCVRVYFARIISSDAWFADYRYTFILHLFLPPESQQKRTHPQLLELQPVLACCRQACIISTAQRSTAQSALQASYYVPVYTCVYCCVLVFFAFFINCPLSVLFTTSILFRKLHPYCRSERYSASKPISQHRAISSAQIALGIIKLLVAPNHGPLLSAPFAFCSLTPCASVAGGVSRPRSGALIVNTCTAAVKAIHMF